MPWWDRLCLLALASVADQVRSQPCWWQRSQSQSHPSLVLDTVTKGLGFVVIVFLVDSEQGCEDFDHYPEDYCPD